LERGFVHFSVAFVLGRLIESVMHPADCKVGCFEISDFADEPIVQNTVVNHIQVGSISILGRDVRK
jgi:hypothetical protein